MPKEPFCFFDKLENEFQSWVLVKCLSFIFLTKFPNLKNRSQVGMIFSFPNYLEIEIQLCSRICSTKSPFRISIFENKNPQLSYFLPSQFEKNWEVFVQFSNFWNLAKLPSLNVKPIE